MEPKTIVIFRMMQGEVLALFPGLPGSPGHCTCYARVGQHSSADYAHCIQASRPAKRAEWAPLAKELKGLGYRLDIRGRRPHNLRGF